MAGREILLCTWTCPLEGAEGSFLSVNAALAERWAPSVASRHLPVPGRI